jgi:SpoIID/LytB domain protein
MCMSGVLGRALRGEKYQTIIPYYYQGVSFGTMDDNTPIRVLCRDNVVRTYTFKEYLYRQLEEPDSWPPEALKVLAIAMRTYAIATKNNGKHAAQGYDICSSGSCCQAFDETIDPAKRPNTVAAVDATAGIIITYNGNPIVAAYSGNCGGHTADASEVWGGTGYPYWKGVPDDACSGMNGHDWTVTMSWSDLEAKMDSNAGTAVGALYAITILSLGESGRVTKMRIQGSAGSKDVSGSLFAAVAGLDTNFFSIAQSNFDDYLHHARRSNGGRLRGAAPFPLHRLRECSLAEHRGIGEG